MNEILKLTDRMTKDNVHNTTQTTKDWASLTLLRNGGAPKGLTVPTSPVPLVVYVLFDNLFSNVVISWKVKIFNRNVSIHACKFNLICIIYGQK